MQWFILNSTATLQSPTGFAVMREKVFHRSEEIGSKSPLVRLRVGDRSPGEHLGEEIMRLVFRRGVPRLAAEKRGHGFVVGFAQFRQACLPAGESACERLTCVQRVVRNASASSLGAASAEAEWEGLVFMPFRASCHVCLTREH